MIKRIVVAGCRDFHDYAVAKDFIEQSICEIRQSYELVFLSGDCTGADQLGERFATENGFSVEHFPAEWETFGKSAGPIRNRKMAESADYVICFWDGKSRGTASMINYAKKLGKPVRVKLI